MEKSENNKDERFALDASDKALLADLREAYNTIEVSRKACDHRKVKLAVEQEILLKQKRAREASEKK